MAHCTTARPKASSLSLVTVCRTQSLSLSLSLSLPEDAYWTLEDMLSNPCPVPFRPRPVPVYVSYPPDKSTHHAILFLSDIFGLALVNSKLIADLFAANGYFVVMPDLFQGDPVPVDHSPSFQVMDWLQGHLPPQTDPIVTATLREMRERLGCQRIGGVGYCYGGKYVVRYLHPGQLDVGFVAHPTFIEPDELEAIEGPLSISASGELFPFHSLLGFGYFRRFLNLKNVHISIYSPGQSLSA